MLQHLLVHYFGRTSSQRLLSCQKTTFAVSNRSGSQRSFCAFVKIRNHLVASLEYESSNNATCRLRGSTGVVTTVGCSTVVNLSIATLRAAAPAACRIRVWNYPRHRKTCGREHRRVRRKECSRRIGIAFMNPVIESALISLDQVVGSFSFTQITVCARVSQFGVNELFLDPRCASIAHHGLP